jgi:hypothetical protein
MFYTYAHYKPDNTLFYIGKGKRRRALSKESRNPYYKNIVEKYGNPKIELLAKWENEQDALDHEMFLISTFRQMGFDLANLSDGGTGTSGFKFNDEQKKRLSDAHLGQVAWNKGLKGVTTAWNKGLKASKNLKKASSKKITCSCGKIGPIGVMTRWHMDNCGVTLPYSARVTVDGIRFQIGRFKTKEEAVEFQNQYYKKNNIVRISWNKGTKGVVKAWNKNVPMREESKLKVSNALKGRVAPNKGIPMSDEQKLKCRLAKLGKPSNAKGHAKIKMEGLSCQAS